MKKTILKSVMLTAVASLAMSGHVWAHHPTYFMDEDLYYRIDENISDQHNEMIGDVTAEDFELMGSVMRSMDANVDPVRAMGEALSGDDATENQAATEAGSQVDLAPGRGISNATRGSTGR